ncbi:MAG TPA: N-formylglutamate amidohydrolase [Azospirillaceae bacterium]|nr:N-formylglutamate amidohydrolase [Azospirillaceae bacterium]
MELYRFQRGETPVLLSIPHGGTLLPPEVAARLTDGALRLPDTDWHLDRLYNFAPALGCGFLAATQSRYLVDLNRDPDGRPQGDAGTGFEGTGVVPLASFDGTPIYRPGAEPDGEEMRRRVEAYWRPYHRRLSEELADLRARFGVAVLLEAHSVRRSVPRLFDGRLPDFSLATDDGRACAPELARRLTNVLRGAEPHTVELNGRIRGGFIARTHAAPGSGIHALQLEISRGVYMDEDDPFRFRNDQVLSVLPTLERFVSAMVDWALEESRAARDAARHDAPGRDGAAAA